MTDSEAAVWIDGEKLNGIWIWSTTGEAITLDFWAPTEPNGVALAELCMGLHWNPNTQGWFDANCDGQLLLPLCESP